jgi:hypothetical protein
MSEPDDAAFDAALEQLAGVVVKALATVQASGGATPALQTSTMLTRLAVGHVLAGCGPKAARDMLAACWRDLQAEIETQNGGATTLN